MKHPDTMTRDAAIVEITALREEIQSRSRRLQELASSVYRKARRSPADETTPIYLAYANSITRFAGMVEQGSVRTERAVRILDLLPEEPEEKLENKEKKPEPLPTPTLSPMESLISSYIEEEGAEIPEDSDEGED